ncbi:MAG: class I SAM-dependent methyltransferase [Methylophilaceae bacterium]
MLNNPIHTVVNTKPSAWLCRFSALIKPQGQVLDLACGTGRNVRWLAGQGFVVEAVDKDLAALASLQNIPNITTRIADLEGAPWPYAERKFDAIVVCRYLHRPLLPLLLQSLNAKGVLIYETFMQGQELYGRPRRPQFLLKPDELLQTYMNQSNIVAFEQGLFDEAQLEEPPFKTHQPAMLQRICLTRLQDKTP